MSKIILAVVGLPGSGKTESSEYLANKTGWSKVHFGHTITEEVRARGMELNEANERGVREALRAKHGMAAIAILNLPKIRTLFKQGSVILESFYSWEEYTTLKEEFGDKFMVLAIYADFKTRAARMLHRAERPLTENELQSRDYSQIEKLHQAGPIARADFTVVNQGSTEELHAALDNILSRIPTA